MLSSSLSQPVPPAHAACTREHAAMTLTRGDSAPKHNSYVLLLCLDNKAEKQALCWLAGVLGALQPSMAGQGRAGLAVYNCNLALGNLPATIWACQCMSLQCVLGLCTLACICDYNGQEMNTSFWTTLPA